MQQHNSHPQRPYSYPGKGLRLFDLLDVTLLNLGADEMLWWDGSGWINQTLPEVADGTYLRLDCTNDPLTAQLEVPSILSDFVQFDITYADGSAEGKLQWNAEDGTLEVGMPGGNVNLQIGQEQLLRCRNTTGVTIPNGSMVYITGASGNKPLVALADADNPATADVLGFTTEAIAHNDNGYVTLTGLVRDVDTSGYTEGDTIYLSETAGEFTGTAPTAPSTVLHAGHVIAVHATAGVIFASVQAHVHLNHTLSDVSITSIASGEILKWNGTIWVNNTLAEAGISPAGNTTAVSTTYTVLTSDDTVLADATGGAFTVTLPTAASADGQKFTIKKTDSSANAVTLDGDAAETIDGVATVSVSAQYEAYTVQSDGANWWIL